MSYGLPCPDDMNPSDVFTSVEQFDGVMSGLVEGILGQLNDDKCKCTALINASLDSLTAALNKQLSALNTTMGNVYTQLSSVLGSQQFLLSSLVQGAVTNIATELQTSESEVLNVTVPVTVVPVPWPVPGPSTPPYPPPPQPPFYPPIGPAPPPPPPGFPPAPPPTPISIVIGGTTVTASQLCQTIAAAPPVVVNGFSYNPTINVLNNGDTLTFNDNGQVSIALSYDVQPNGSVIVNIGPISVMISLPPTNPADNAPACQLAPA